MRGKNLDLTTCVVQRGKADKVWKAAKAAGAGGATIYFGRGMGIRERLGPLGIAIYAEKEIIQIVSSKKLTRKIFDAIVKAGGLEHPGMGFAFVQEVSHAVGFFEEIPGDRK
jgi:nitrogen regulatory protein PII